METTKSLEVARGAMDDDDHEEAWVHDSSVDHRGRSPARATTGSWKAAMFIILIEFSERLSYFGIATSLMIYLTKVLQEEMKAAAKNANYWMSVTTLMPLLGGFLADGYLGRFSTVVVSTAVYLLGLTVLATAQLAPGLGPDRSPRLHEALFFAGIYLVSAGTGGHKPALESFGADQFDEAHAAERVRKMSFFNWWNCALCSGVLLGVTAVVYAQDRAGWGAATVALAAVMAASLAVFLAGRRYYRYRVPEGSPLTPLLQVLVAAFRNRRLPLPDDDAELYEVRRPQSGKRRLLCHTYQLRFLDKAAIVVEPGAGEDACGPWRLATVTQVEETKLVLAMVPIWVCTLPFGMAVAQVSTFFIKQSSVMDRRLGPHFEPPPASVFALSAVAMIGTVAAYDKALVPYLRRATGGERGISILGRVGIGMAFAIAGLGVAAAVERRRLLSAGAARPSTSVLWLVPQFALMGVADGFALVGLQEYFYEQVPDGMRSLGIGLYLSVIGAGSFLSSLVITAADRASSRGGRAGWFAKDLNRSRLDLFYWLLACISAVNLAFYALVATKCSYKQTVRAGRVGDEVECAA
ncbi:protein NRT1/ PTR FAMILY 5.6 [Zea mays]|uniref:Protein NRT1/ PTR FAMILY 5.6 n=2 Tax=Zea mays TaxID=4577 RepID=A0A1D6GE39_MAIZE|nr:protein NRT1/ PTR FAMILY 5.6 [Zea mays]AQK61883.1 Protein NRT1/ PTR FAMILY 5.6 [Zea mays]|eukprot:XP_008644373.1 protein NRT1/ PTR FAMILY 5.6 [Zea mays]